MLPLVESPVHEADGAPVSGHRHSERDDRVGGIPRDQFRRRRGNRRLQLERPREETERVRIRRRVLREKPDGVGIAEPDARHPDRTRVAGTAGSLDDGFDSGRGGELGNPRGDAATDDQGQGVRAPGALAQRP